MEDLHEVDLECLLPIDFNYCKKPAMYVRNTRAKCFENKISLSRVRSLTVS